MKIEIRPEISVLMFNCAVVKNWKRSVAWFQSYGAKCIVDANANFQENAMFYVVIVNCDVSVYYRVT